MNRAKSFTTETQRTQSSEVVFLCALCVSVVFPPS